MESYLRIMSQKIEPEVGIIIQARTGSKRFPNKVILNYYDDKSILEIIIRNLLSVYSNRNIILATTLASKDDVLVNLASRLEVATFRGDEENVLQRFIDAANFYKYKYIIRVCADNPFMLVKSIDQLLSINYGGYDYVGYYVDENTPAIKSHLGLYPELINLEALEKVQKKTNDEKYLEHVTNYIYTNPTLFNIKWIKVDNEVFFRDDIRLTIDTFEDFKISQEIYKYYNLKDLSLSELLKIIDNNPSIKIRMKQQIGNNKK